MRDIKFRVFDRWSGEYTNYQLTDNLLYALDKDRRNGAGWKRVRDDRRFIVQQYTGLHDKCNREIYDGDILHLTGKDTLRSYDWKAIVEFGNPNGLYDWGFQLNPITDFEANTDILLWVEMEEVGVFCEIIGNINETPELLEGAKGWTMN